MMSSIVPIIAANNAIMATNAMLRKSAPPDVEDEAEVEEYEYEEYEENEE